jgi:hypothetical protein
MNRKMCFISAAICVLVLLSACEMGVQEHGHKASADEKAVIRIGVQYTGAVVGRSVLPEFAQTDITYFVLLGDSGAGETELASFTPDTITEASVTLDPGIWDFTLNAYKDDEALFLRGKLLEQQIASDDSLNFTLTPLSNGQGTISITINFPANAGIAAASAVTETGDEESLVINDNRVIYTKETIDAGDYFIRFMFKDSNGVIITIISEIVAVRSYLRTETTITLEPADLDFILMSPEGLRVINQSGDSITLEWSAVLRATRYTIYRSDTEEGPYEPIDSSDSPSYTDTGLAEETTYYYQVSAVNDKGVESGRSFGPVSGTTLLVVPIMINLPGEWDLVPQSLSVIQDTLTPFSLAETYDAYQWYLNGAPVGTNLTYTFDAGGGKKAGSVYELVVVVTSISGQQRSGTCRITIIDSNTVPYNARTSEELTTALSAIQSSAEDNFTITVTADLSIDPVSLTDAGYSGKTITLKGDRSERTMSLSSTGSLFTVGSGVTLILENNITLMGRSDNIDSLVKVDSGNLIMNNGAKITGNTTSSGGGGVHINSGDFTMNGGSITDNEVLANNHNGGGGVYINNGTFTINNGDISSNRASSTNAYVDVGGGVCVMEDGTFIMNGGKIRDNTASVSGYYADAGGGIWLIDSGIFSMTGGEISGNTASSSYSSITFAGGGVCMNSGTLTK